MQNRHQFILETVQGLLNERFGAALGVGGVARRSIPRGALPVGVGPIGYDSWGKGPPPKVDALLIPKDLEAAGGVGRVVQRINQPKFMDTADYAHNFADLKSMEQAAQWTTAVDDMGNVKLVHKPVGWASANRARVGIPEPPLSQGSPRYLARYSDDNMTGVIERTRINMIKDAIASAEAAGVPFTQRDLDRINDRAYAGTSSRFD
jgi:hypothetical protein